jgi:hypothetical protein
MDDWREALAHAVHQAVSSIRSYDAPAVRVEILLEGQGSSIPDTSIVDQALTALRRPRADLSAQEAGPARPVLSESCVVQQLVFTRDLELAEPNQPVSIRIWISPCEQRDSEVQPMTRCSS